MRGQIRRHIYVTTAIVLGIATIVGGFGWWWPDSRDWLSSHAGTGWLVALIACVLAVETWIVSDRDVAALEDVRDGLQADLKDEREAHSNELVVKDREIADLTARLYPSERDVLQFKRVEEWLPWERGTMTWLEAAFTGDRWTDKQSDPLYRLEGHWREWFFNDPLANEAFGRLRSAVDKLTDWMAGNGSADTSDRDADPEAGKSFRYTIAQPHEREGGYPAYDAARKEARRLARIVIEERREFEKVARSRGM
ncbi:hypothetical protein GCM10009737_10090 [Nocardioides lentus]|uniref:Uncharacterized protein n=1 Tax=Nocardioides lentus TaxID=338077 RepID=A0ABN2P2H5_9ACTN